MATILTYARPVSHDRAYFSDPLKLLDGLILPPSFNLRNEAMVRKHVHAAVLTVLHQLARRGSPLSGDDRHEIRETLELCFPQRIRRYLFDRDGNVRHELFDVSALAALVPDQALKKAQRTPNHPKCPAISGILAVHQHHQPQQEGTSGEETG